MSESRQQRRARERAEAKAASRPGLNLDSAPVASPQPAAQQRAVVLEVDLGRYVARDDPSDVTWAATWGLRDASVGTEDSTEDLAELVRIILEDAQPLGDQYDVRIEWTLRGDPADGQAVADAIAAAGVTLPGRLPGDTDLVPADEVKVNPSPASTGTTRVSAVPVQSYPVTGTSGSPESGS